MTPIDHFICLLLGCLIGHLIVYIARGIWNFLTSKRVEIPEIKYDVADNPILSLKNRLGQAYVASHDQTVKKLLHRLLEYVEVIDEWHNAKIHLAETECYTHKTRAARLNVELEIERSKNAELEKQLKEEREKNKIPLFTKPVEAPDYLIEKRFPGQTDPFIKITMDEEALKRAIDMQTCSIIHMDSEDLNRYSVGRGPDGKLLKDELPISNEVAEKLRDWWGLEADKGKPSRKSIYDMSSEEMQGYFRDILIDRNVHNLPLNWYKVEAYKSVNNGRKAMSAQWILPATSINAIRNVLGEEGIQVVGAEELP